MKRDFFNKPGVSFYVFLILVLAACSGRKEDNYPGGIGHVIVIGVDGLSPDGIRKAETPVMDKMIAEGAVKWNVRTVLPSSSSQNWASMIMGAGREQHGVLDNDWEREDHSLPPIVMGSEGIFPTIFGLVRSSDAGAEIGAVYHWQGFGRLFEKKAVNYDRNYSTEDSTAEAFIQYLGKSKPVFSFVHLDHVDHAGHHDGHGTKPYYESVSKADTLIGRILDAVRTSGMEENTLVIIMSDHGGLGHGHGGATPAEAEVAMIFSGKGIRKGYVIRQEVYNYDLAATIAFALRLVPPYAWTGRPVKAAFEGFSEPANLWEGSKRLSSPEIRPPAVLNQKAGALVIDSQATVEIMTTAGESISRYTLDGSEPDSASPEYKAPFRLDSTTVVKASSFDKQGNKSLPSTAYFRVLRSGRGNGLNIGFYPGKGWRKLPDFNASAATKQWKAHEFSIDLDQVSGMLDKKSSNFGLLYKGFLEIDAPGNYTFYTQSDDGSKLFIGGKEVVNNDGSHGVTEKAGSIELSAGKHPITVEYFNEMGGFWLDALYKGPGKPKQLIPADKLFLNK